MSIIKDLTNQTFGRLTVLSRANEPENVKRKKIYWRCRCICGQMTIVASTKLTNGHTKSCGCLKNDTLKVRNDANRVWKFEIGQIIITDKINYTLTDKTMEFDRPFKRTKAYKYVCNICGYAGTVYESRLNANIGCPCCTGKVVVAGINDIPTTEPWMIPYFINGFNEAKYYTRRSNKKILMICPLCRRTKHKTIAALCEEKSIGCTCGDKFSYPEKFMANVFEQLNINFKWRYTSDWLKGYNGNKRSLEFDFVLPEHNLIVEIDGGLGHGKGVHKLSKESAIESKNKDIWKDAQAELNGYKVIRIDADKSEMEYLKFNITNCLSHLFCLDNINWMQCDIRSQRNIVKEIAEYYENNKPISTAEIGTIFNICTETARNYLKKAKQYNWCSYDPNYGKQNKSQA